MLQDVLAKNSKALTTPSGGGVPMRELPGERTTRLQGGSDASWNVSLSEPSRSTDGAAHADSGNRASARTLRIPEDSRAAEPGGRELRRTAIFKGTIDIGETVKDAQPKQPEVEPEAPVVRSASASA